MYVRVHACSKQCRACNHPRARLLPFLRPTTLPLPPSRRALLFREAATILTVPHQPLPLPIRSTADHPHRPSLLPATTLSPPSPPPPPPPFPPSSIALHLNSVSTASLLLPSATHTTTHSFHSHHVRRPSLPFPRLFSFPFCFHFRLPQTPDPIHPAGKTVRCRKYGEHRRGLSKRMR